MPKICYTPHKFSDPATVSLIERIDGICQSFAAQGYDLTLRQLHYQVFPQYPDDRRWTWDGSKWRRDPNGSKNAQPNYKWLGEILTEARMAGFINWSHVVDRTRNLMGNEHWTKPSELVKQAEARFALDKWNDQPHYVEVWIEKDALEGVISRICGQMDVPFFSCRGYTSLSEMWVAGQRLVERLHKNKQVHIIHLGDHDPSGLDMSRDIKDRLTKFITAHMPGESVHVLRAALNMAQIERLNLAPNPTKMGDSRTADYVEKFGEECWELDALNPSELNAIVERAVKMYRDEETWAASVKREARGRRTLGAIHADFTNVVKYLRGEIS